MDNKILSSIAFRFLFILVLVLTVQIASASLGTVKQNECISIRVLANCSSINITEVSDGTNTFVLNTPMEKLGGQTFNYTFCDTASIGDYSYSWNNPCVDCATDECGNDFEVTPSGFGNTLGFYIVMIILVGGLIVLGFTISEEWFVILGGMGLIMLGIYSINYGIAGFRDMFMTWGLGLFEIGVGFILSVGSAFQLVKDD
jgi:hypothetical protein